MWAKKYQCPLCCGVFVCLALIFVSASMVRVSVTVSMKPVEQMVASVRDAVVNGTRSLTQGSLTGLWLSPSSNQATVTSKEQDWPDSLNEALHQDGLLSTVRCTDGVRANASSDDATLPSWVIDCPAQIPRIVHMVWLYPLPAYFRFHNLISSLSSLKFIRPVRYMLHYKTLPTGQWWTSFLEALENSKSCLELVPREIPEQIFGNRIKHPEHKADVVRLEAVNKYGGVYLDFDVIVLRPVDGLLCFETVMGEEDSGLLNNGVIMSVPHTEFLRIWYDTYKTFRAGEWGAHSIYTPGRLAKKYPYMVHVEKNSMHKPNWRPVQRALIYTPGLSFDWRSKYTVHLWYRFYDKEHNPDDIKTLGSMLGEMFRFIYYGSANEIR